jgi:hypothetical protein
VDREVDLVGQQRLLDLLGEEGLASDRRERHVGHAVAGGADDHQLDRRRARLGRKQRLDAARLPEGQLGAARADAQRVRRAAHSVSPRAVKR